MVRPPAFWGPSMHHSFWRFGGALIAPLALIVLSACGAEENIRTYSVPKGSETIGGPTASPHAHTHDHTHDHTIPTGAGSAEAIWIVPEGWREMPDNPPMRLATYIADGPHGDVEIAITRFPGDVGGMLANVNRWRSQMGLVPILEDELDDHLQEFGRPGFEGHFLRIEGVQSDMLAASIHETAADRTWFVRVITDSETADHVETEVFEFARTFGAGEGI